MTIPLRYTTADLDLLPDIEGTRYEIIDGELHVTGQPHGMHQYTCSRVASALDRWDDESGIGMVIPAPGVAFSPENAVAPDLVWIRRERLSLLMDEAGHLRAAPELVVEVLSAGAANEKRDRELKLRLYSAWGVGEYWIVDWQLKSIWVYRRQEAALVLAATLAEGDVLTSPLFPGFSCPVSRLWPV